MSYQSDRNHTTDKLSGFERLMVESDMTSFWEGLEFRSYKELNIAGSAVYVVKAVVPLNIVLVKLEVTIESGHLRIGTYVGGTEGGSFSETLPKFGTNNMSVGVNHRKNVAGVAYASQTVLTAGGTHTGGTELDVIRVKAESNSVHAQTVGSSESDQRGIAANTYYFRLLNLSSMDAVEGVFRVRWEERPVGFFQT